jgi:hypothetical protein
VTPEQVLVALAARGLPGAPPIRCDEPLDDPSWRWLHAEVERNRLTGLLAIAIAEGELPVTEVQDQQAGVAELNLATHVVSLERLLLDVVERFDGAGVDLRVLKGPAFAHTAYSLPEARPFADIDILVRGRQLEQAGHLLDELGIARRVPELRPGFDRRFARTITRATTKGGFVVDVHRTLASGPFTFLVDADELFTRPSSFELAGRRLARLDPTLAFVHSCVHLVLGGRPRLLTVRDVVEHARLDGLDPAAAADIAARWRLTAVVARALDDAQERLGLDRSLFAELRRELDPTAEERRLLAGFRAEVGHSDEQALGSLAHVPGVRLKAAFALAHVWPTPANLAARRLTRRSHLRHVARGLLRFDR